MELMLLHNSQWLAEWRYVSTTPMELSVMTSGMNSMPQLSVGNWHFHQMVCIHALGRSCDIFMHANVNLSIYSGMFVSE